MLSMPRGTGRSTGNRRARSRSGLANGRAISIGVTHAHDERVRVERPHDLHPDRKPVGRRSDRNRSRRLFREIECGIERHRVGDVAVSRIARPILVGADRRQRTRGRDQNVVAFVKARMSAPSCSRFSRAARNSTTGIRAPFSALSRRRGFISALSAAVKPNTRNALATPGSMSVVRTSPGSSNTCSTRSTLRAELLEKLDPVRHDCGDFRSDVGKTERRAVCDAQTGQIARAMPRRNRSRRPARHRSRADPAG